MQQSKAKNKKYISPETSMIDLKDTFIEKKNGSLPKTLTKEKFAAKLAHDLRSPLAVMQIILHDINQSISIENYEFLNEAIKKMHRMINDSLFCYKTSHYPDLKNDVNLYCLVNQVLLHKKIEWQNKPCYTSFTASEQAKNINILGLESDISRVISNLLNNAFEALETTRNIHINLSLKNNNLHLSIHDSGIGIDQKLVSLILAGKSIKLSGNGLGLSGAKEFMENRGDKLLFKSEKGEGTIVTLLFKLPKLSLAGAVQLG